MGAPHLIQFIMGKLVSWLVTGLVVCALFLSITAFRHQAAAPAAPPADQLQSKLVVFVNSGQAVSEKFKANELKEIEAYANAVKVDFEVVDISQAGAPAEVTLTPLIYFQNALGRSVYYGRYAELSRLKNFVRTSRRIPQRVAQNPKENILTWQNQQAVLAVPIKITGLAGTQPAGFNQQQFEATAKTAIAGAMQKFGLTAKINLRRTDRSFYMDFYPYRAEDGQLYLSMAIFSQFSCVEPVYSNMDAPLTGSFDNYAEVFAQGAAQLEQEITRLMTASEIGDAFDPTPTNITTKTWAELGLALPEKNDQLAAGVDYSKVTIPTKWEIAGPVDEFTPMLQFNFLAPLEGYQGEAKDFTGNMLLSDAVTLEGATGQFKVNTASVTMGIATLDEKVHAKYIKVGKFPKSSFTFTNAVGNLDPLAFGTATQVQVTGVFEMMKKKIDLVVNTQIEPGLDDQGKPQLMVSASFQLPLTAAFGVAGPDGPSPAKDNMMFYLNFIMKPQDNS